MSQWACENSYLTFDPASGGPMDDLIGHSITYVAMGPRAGQKVFTLHAGIGIGAQLKTAYRAGTTHVLLEPLDLLARLTALVPPPSGPC